jgi:peptide/nickel transport system permease protein
MKLGDAGHALAEFWSDFRKDRSGLVGLGILAVTIFVVVLEPALLPWKEANSRWRDIDYWQDNSASAPPAWVNLFRREKAPITSRIAPSRREEADLDGGAAMLSFEFNYRFAADRPPLDVIFHGRATGDVPIMLSVERPDGEVIELAQRMEVGLSDDDIRVSIANSAREAVFAFVRRFESEDVLAGSNDRSFRAASIAFGTARPGMATKYEALKGGYKFVVSTILADPAAFSLEDPYLVISGSVSGVLGTDAMKRDIFSGLIAGLKWALFIGLLTSAVSVIIGVVFGIVSAYFGGAVDAGMQFVYQVVRSTPVLPVLIVVSAVFRPSIWFIIGVMVIFFWVGPVATVRSMAFQIREETYIESAKALGAGHWRIIFRHMMPILIPYSFASMALAVPGAIVYESTISLLGLGDATMVTWGQILHDAITGGAVLNGLWWWVVPPGLLIAIMGMTFAFLGFAMDKILHPKLRTR